MDTLPVGTIQVMTVDRSTEHGYVLTSDDKEALLHHNEATDDIAIGDAIKVFIYTDKKGNISASMQLPAVTIDSYNWADVVEVKADLGVFVDIGTTKDILVSKDDLPLYEHVWPVTGDKLFVTLGKDRRGRLLALPATEGIINHYREWAPEEHLNKIVTGRVYRTSKEGTAIWTDEDYRGFIHHSERKKEPRMGEKVTGRVIAVKEDGTLNITLLPLKKESIPADADMILEYIEAQDGMMLFSDKSDPEDIRNVFHISKAAFKRALGSLMKAGKIEQRDGKTYLK